VPKITDIALRNLAAPSRGQITLIDDASPLRVRISQGGAKTFVVSLGRGRRQTIGRFGEVSLADAREAARKLRAELTLGRIIPTTKNLDDARQEYLNEIEIRDVTRGYYRRNLNRLTARKIRDITPSDITNILGKLTPSSRLQCLRSYTAFFNWAISKHYLDRSPCERMEGGRNKRRDRVLSVDELRAIWDATSDVSDYHCIIRLLITTGQRKTEWAHCQDNWIAEYGVSFPAAICKNNNRHHFPLGELSRSILPARKGLLFPTDENTAFCSWSKSKVELNSDLDIASWQLRDLRRTYRTIHASIGTSREISERLINHVSDQGELEKIYDQFDYAEPMKLAQDRYEAHLKTILRIT
jgi:Arm domain-containing DNA-binding protein